MRLPLTTATLQHPTTHCNTLPRAATQAGSKEDEANEDETASDYCNFETLCNILQHTAPQPTAIHRNTLQHVATQCIIGWEQREGGE